MYPVSDVGFAERQHGRTQQEGSLVQKDLGFWSQPSPLSALYSWLVNKIHFITLWFIFSATQTVTTQKFGISIKLGNS